MIGILKIV